MERIGNVPLLFKYYTVDLTQSQQFFKKSLK